MKCKIVLRYTYRNYVDELKDYQEEFITIPTFSNYLRWEPLRAMAIGYGEVNQDDLKKSRSTNVRLSLRFENGEEVFFNNATEFVDYLTKHPDLAKRLQFSPKSK